MAREYSNRCQPLPGEQNGSLAALQDISIIEYLHNDKRPVFVLDLGDDNSGANGSISIAFINPALRESETLFNLLNDHDSKTSPATKSGDQSFLNWAKDSSNASSLSVHQYAGLNWTRTDMGQRWRILAANISNLVPHTADTQDTIKATSATSALPVADTCQSFQHNSRATKPSDPLLRARSFFVGEAVTRRDSKNAKNLELQKDSENFNEDTDRGVPSDIVVARRNAELLSRISASDSVGIFLTNTAGEIIYANNAWYNICGLPLGQTDAMSWMSIYEESEIPIISDMWTRVIVEQEQVHFQTPLKRTWNPPGSDFAKFPVWISVWGYADVSLDGETVGGCAVTTDITQQKWTEKLIQKQLDDAVERAKVLEQLSNDLAMTEARHRRLMDSIPYGIFRSDKLGNLLFTNVAYRNTFPASADPSLSEPWWSYIPEEEEARAKEIWAKLQDLEEVSFEMSFLKSSESGTTNERRHMAIAAYPELDEGGVIHHIAGCLSDISDLKTAEQMQVARADSAEESNRKLEQFIDMTSHEIRNPLSAIIHSAEEILLSLRSPKWTDTTTSNAIEAVDTIINCTNHSTRIVDDILMVSKIESNLVSIAPSPVQLIPAIRNALKMFDGEIRAADIFATLTVDQSFHDLKIDWVCLDISRVLQIFVNLITNAIKFTRPEKTRQINTRLRACLVKPTNDSDDGPQYLPNATDISDSDTKPNSKLVYIVITVTDS